MPDYAVAPFLLIRSPAYSYFHFSPAGLISAIRTDFFKAAIFLASQTLFTELRQADFSYDELSPGLQFTLWKYFNRMCYRALPYALFSSYSSPSWVKTNSSAIFLEEIHRIVINPDFKVLSSYLQTLEPQQFEHLLYAVNSSLYQSFNRLRFITQGKGLPGKFAVAELMIVPGLKKLLKFIHQRHTRAEIISYLQERYGSDVPVQTYFETLLNAQVIVPELTPNVTGLKYNFRIDSLIGRSAHIDQLRLKSFTKEFSDQAAAMPDLRSHVDGLSALGTENSAYCVYEREATGGLGDDVQQELVSLIGRLDKLTADHHLEQMTSFKKAFLQKFDQQEVGLMTVLDPTIGIGYENLTTVFEENDEDFIEDVLKRREQREHSNWGTMEKLVFEQWNRLRQKKTDPVCIPVEDIDRLPESDHTLPPGLFVLFKSIGEEIWIDAIGGVSGIELAARFAVDSKEIQSSLRAICQQEMQINQEVVFAEIAFAQHDRTSNINQRPHLYDYEIPVLSYSTLSDRHVILPDELLLSVRNNCVLLRSSRLNKYVIPRLSSAYNFQLSPIPVFRFLCDLQFQGLKSNLAFSLSSLFPGLGYYPRLQIGKVVLSAATWMLSEKQIQGLFHADNQLNEELGLPERFSLNEGDNFLVFNKNVVQDMEMLRKCLKNKTKATLVEYVIPEKSVLKDRKGEPFCAQLLTTMINKNTVYHAPVIPGADQRRRPRPVKRTFLPGDEWIYAKIYAHYSLSNDILVNYIFPLVRKYKKDNPEFKWFYIRYKDPADHLRVRFFASRKSPYSLLAELMQKLKSWSGERKIADVMLDSYQRELEKYSPALIPEIERFFYRDSELVLAVFKKQTMTTSFKLCFAVISSLVIVHYFLKDKLHRSAFLKAVAEGALEEFSRDKEVIRKLDKKYRSFQKELIAYQPGPATAYVSSYYRQLERLVLETRDWQAPATEELLLNLVHLHVNRIFEHHPREYEYVIYHFMKKHQAFLDYTRNGGF